MMDRDLQKRLDAVCRRLRLLSLLQAAVSGMVAASAVCALLLVASLVLPLPAYALVAQRLTGLIILFVRWDRPIAAGRGLSSTRSSGSKNGSPQPRSSAA